MSLKTWDNAKIDSMVNKYGLNLTYAIQDEGIGKDDGVEIFEFFCFLLVKIMLMELSEQPDGESKHSILHQMLDILSEIIQLNVQGKM